jgi:hypothetical protein
MQLDSINDALGDCVNIALLDVRLLLTNDVQA